MKKRSMQILAILIVATELAGAVSSLVSGPISVVYRSLEKPPLSPPGWVFGAVWPLLYALMAVAAWRVWRARQGFGGPLTLYWVQLAVNVLWPIVFFRFGAYPAALVVLIVLDILVAITVRRFGREDRGAGLLLLPYLLWILFATYLNAGVALLN